ncbi:unnamed protein product, partial [Allacma fusca]
MAVSCFRILLLLSILICGVCGKGKKFIWTNRIQLAPELEFKWDISDPDFITGEVVANGVQGYAGIGFSPSGGMPGSDI